MKQLFLILTAAVGLTITAFAETPTDSSLPTLPPPPQLEDRVLELTPDKTVAHEYIHKFLAKLYKNDNIYVDVTSVFSVYNSGPNRYLIAKAFVTFYNQNSRQEVRGVILDLDADWTWSLSESELNYFVRTG